MEGATSKPNSAAKEDFTVGIYIYRAIRLLNDLHNITFGSLFVPIVKLVTLLGLLISTYVTIKLRSLMHPVVFIFFLVYMLDILIVTFLAAVTMSKIFSWSSFFHIQKVQLLNLLPQICRSDLKRQLKSFPMLKCQVGPFYHMEGKAKLTMADNTTQGVAFMLVTFN